MNYYTADTHFGHQNIVEIGDRPFKDIDEHDETIIKNWNNKVSEEDNIWILGDLSYRSSKHIAHYLERLKGRKHLMIGNHDNRWMKNVANLKQYFASIDYMTQIMDGNKSITLCHYPMMEWYQSRYAENDVKKGTSWLIHGHIHNRVDNREYWFIKQHLPCALNAGVDINNFEPVTFEELVKNNNIWYERKMDKLSADLRK